MTFPGWRITSRPVSAGWSSPVSDAATHVARPLILLLTPTDRHGDAQRLADAGFRVIATSRAETSLRQVFAAQPAVIAIEWIPSFAADTLAYIALLMVSVHAPRLAVVVYGTAAGGCDAEVRGLGADWVEVTPGQREELVTRVRGSDGSALPSRKAHPIA